MSEYQSHPVESEAEANPYRKRVVELFEMGLSSEDIYGYHGTSVEAILSLAQHGRLPTEGMFGSEFHYQALGLGHEDAIEEGITYAGWNAQKFYVLSHLPFRPEDMSRFRELFSERHLHEEWFLSEAAKHGLSRDDARQLLKEAEGRKGVILTLSERVKALSPERAPKEGSEKVDVPGGLPIEYITGIEPVGEYEYKELEKLQLESERG